MKDIGGPIVWTHGNYVLRSDKHLRNEEESYSLCVYEPFSRVHIYTGPLDWAIQQSLELIYSEVGSL